MNHEPEPSGLLLPRTDPLTADEAKRAARFLRLLSDDARGKGRTHRATVDPIRAAEELEARGRARLLDALVDLMRIAWNAALEPESFLDAEPAELAYQDAWSVLSESRRDRPSLPEVPAPGEQPLALARRLLAAAGELGLPEGERALWSNRLELTDGRGDADSALERLRTAQRVEASPALVEAVLADAAAARLDRGAVRAAQDLLAEVTPSPGGRADTLASWCRTLLGGDRVDLFAGAAGTVPAPLLELREDVPSLLPALAGSPVENRGPLRILPAYHLFISIDPATAAFKDSTARS